MPLIADFLSDDASAIDARKRETSEKSWQLAASRAETRIARLGLATARSGLPTRSGTPIRTHGNAFFQPLPAWTPSPLVRAALIGLLVLGAFIVREIFGR